jgi:hypothetical protein
MNSGSVKHEATSKEVFFQAGIPAILTCSLIPFAFLNSQIDSTRAPYFDLTQTFSQVAYWLSESGGKFGAPIVAALMLMLLVTRVGITSQRRWMEASTMALVVAMLFATFLLAISATYLATKRRWLFYALLPWALAVYYSRPILRVHTPTDITIGGLEDLVLGLMAWAIARMLIRRFA